MRVTLLHNPKAGRSEYSKAKLIAALEDGGHRVTYRSTKGPDWETALAKPADIILVAGGDGTVGKVARQLVGTKTPLSVLPLGTANNLARTLGFTGKVETLISQLRDGKPRGFDVGLVRGQWGERYIFEGVGGGLLAEYLGGPKRATENLSTEEEMTLHVCQLRKLLNHYQAREWKLRIDGEELHDRFLLFEAMNICSVGPVLNLAPAANTGDGHFDLVLARESERDTLMDYLAVRLRGKKAPAFPLPACNFRRLQIPWKRTPIHLDDDLWPEDNDKQSRSGEIEISVLKSALVVFRPD